MPDVNRQWRLAARPVGLIKASDFSWSEQPRPEPHEGQFVVRNLYLSLDPTNRGWMRDTASYLPPVGIGEVMRGFTLGRVYQTRHPDFPEGTLVQGTLGWQDYALSDGRGVTGLPADPSIPLTAYLALFGHIGLTAYFGLLDIGQPKAGETLVVSAAAGAVGSLVGQIGKIMGCRVVGITGSDAKCRWITEELGFDAAINYKREPLRRRLMRHCRDGVDVCFENVGGEILDSVLALINLRARVVLCGLIAQYNAEKPVPGPCNLVNVLVRRARLEGFIVLDYLDRAAEATAHLARWFAEGKLTYRAEVIEGLEQAPHAINKLFDGSNTGKLIVKI